MPMEKNFPELAQFFPNMLYALESIQFVIVFQNINNFSDLNLH